MHTTEPTTNEHEADEYAPPRRPSTYYRAHQGLDTFTDEVTR